MGLPPSSQKTTLHAAPPSSSQGKLQHGLATRVEALKVHADSTDVRLADVGTQMQALRSQVLEVASLLRTAQASANGARESAQRQSEALHSLSSHVHGQLAQAADAGTQLAERVTGLERQVVAMRLEAEGAADARPAAPGVAELQQALAEVQGRLEALEAAAAAEAEAAAAAAASPTANEASTTTRDAQTDVPCASCGAAPNHHQSGGGGSGQHAAPQPPPPPRAITLDVVKTALELELCRALPGHIRRELDSRAQLAAASTPSASAAAAAAAGLAEQHSPGGSPHSSARDAGASPQPSWMGPVAPAQPDAAALVAENEIWERLSGAASGSAARSVQPGSSGGSSRFPASNSYARRQRPAASSATSAPPPAGGVSPSPSAGTPLARRLHGSPSGGASGLRDARLFTPASCVASASAALSGSSAGAACQRSASRSVERRQRLAGLFCELQNIKRGMQ